MTEEAAPDCATVMASAASRTGSTPIGRAPHRQPCRERDPYHRDTAMRITLADDAVPFREGVANPLREAGFDRVGQARDAGELLTLIRKNTFDIALPLDQATHVAWV